MTVNQIHKKYFKNVLKINGTMCCMVSFKRYIFAVQITMQRKVDSFKMYYTHCNEIEFQASIESENNFRKQKTKF